VLSGIKQPGGASLSFGIVAVRMYINHAKTNLYIRLFFLCCQFAAKSYLKIPYFSIDNARVIYTKKVSIRKKMNMRGIH
jgi:hypothetical protein